MSDFGINEMLDMQRALQERYKDKWEGISPEVGKNKLLWMIGEVGEVIDIVKKHGPEASNADHPEREHLIEELADVLMYYNDVLLCEDLKEIFPDIKSFSPTNLKYMRYFYEMYPTGLNRPQLGDDSENELNRPQAGDDLENAIFFIPWGHNKVIIDKCKGDSAKALFYVKKTLENNWSRDVLLNFLASDFQSDCCICDVGK